MKVKRFISESGFKVLAMARLSQAEYSVVLYLLNTAVSGLDQLLTTEDELALSLGYERIVVHDAIRALGDRNIIRLQFGEGAAHSERASLSIGMQFDISRWTLAFDLDVNSHDAIIYPFRRRGVAAFQIVAGQKRTETKDDGKQQPTWRRVVESYEKGRAIDSDELVRAQDDAKILVDTHPVDQILIMIRHFGLRIPTLSLLASSWPHFQELYETETQKIDMLDARLKHAEMDEKIRKAARTVMEAQEELQLSEEELTVLQILSQHRYPRRQLFWAYQTRSRYPKLSSFFSENASLMLPVTSLGQVVKWHHEV